MLRWKILFLLLLIPLVFPYYLNLFYQKTPEGGDTSYPYAVPEIDNYNSMVYTPSNANKYYYYDESEGKWKLTEGVIPKYEGVYLYVIDSGKNLIYAYPLKVSKSGNTYTLTYPYFDGESFGTFDITIETSNMGLTNITKGYWEIPAGTVIVTSPLSEDTWNNTNTYYRIKYNGQKLIEKNAPSYIAGPDEPPVVIFISVNSQKKVSHSEEKYVNAPNVFNGKTWIYHWITIPEINDPNEITVENSIRFEYNGKMIYGIKTKGSATIKVTAWYYKTDSVSCPLSLGWGVQECHLTPEYVDLSIDCPDKVSKGSNSIVCTVYADNTPVEKKYIYYEIVPLSENQVGTSSSQNNLFKRNVKDTFELEKEGIEDLVIEERLHLIGKNSLRGDSNIIKEGSLSTDENGKITIDISDLNEGKYKILVYPAKNGNKIDIGSKRGEDTFEVVVGKIDSLVISAPGEASKDGFNFTISLRGTYLQDFNGSGIEAYLNGTEITVDPSTLSCDKDDACSMTLHAYDIDTIGKNVTLNVSIINKTGGIVISNTTTLRIYKLISTNSKKGYNYTLQGNFTYWNTTITRDKKIKLYETNGKVNVTFPDFSVTYTVTITKDTDSPYNVDEAIPGNAPNITNISLGNLPSEIPAGSNVNIPIHIEGFFPASAGNLVFSIDGTQIDTREITCTLPNCDETYTISINASYVGRNRTFEVYWDGNQSVGDSKVVNIYKEFTISGGLDEIYVENISGDFDIQGNGTETVTIKMYSQEIKIRIAPKNYGGYLPEKNYTITVNNATDFTVYPSDQYNFYVSVTGISDNQKIYYWTEYTLHISSNFYWNIELPNGTILSGSGNATRTFYVDKYFPTGDSEIKVYLGENELVKTIPILIKANTTIVSDVNLSDVRVINGENYEVRRISSNKYRVYYTGDSITLRLIPERDYEPAEITVYRDEGIVEVDKSYFTYKGPDYIKRIDYTEEVDIDGKIIAIIEATGTVEVNGTARSPREIPGNVTIELDPPEEPGRYTYVVFLRKDPSIRESFKVKVYYRIEIVGRNSDIEDAIPGSGVECEVDNGEAICKLYKEYGFVTLYPENLSMTPMEIELSLDTPRKYYVEFESMTTSASTGYQENKTGTFERPETRGSLDYIIQKIPLDPLTKLYELVMEYKEGNKSVEEEIVELINAGETVEWPTPVETDDIDLPGYNSSITAFSVKIEYQYKLLRAKVTLENLENKTFDTILIYVPVKTAEGKREINGTEYLVFNNTGKVSFTVRMRDLEEALNNMKIYALKKVTPPRVTGAFVRVGRAIGIGAIVIGVSLLGFLAVRRYNILDYFFGLDKEIEEYLKEKGVVSKREIVKVFKDKEKIKRALKKLWKEGKISVNKYDIVYHA